MVVVHVRVGDEHGPEMEEKAVQGLWSAEDDEQLAKGALFGGKTFIIFVKAFFCM
jgi:hypothetical protein